MAKGINVAGDVLVTQTADCVDLNVLWKEIADALALYKSQRSTVVRLLSYPTVAVADIIAQSMKGESFEVATEFGVPGTDWLNEGDFSAPKTPGGPLGRRVPSSSPGNQTHLDTRYLKPKLRAGIGFNS